MKRKLQKLKVLLFTGIFLLNSAYYVIAQTMSAGGNHSVYVCANGEARATGGNTFGQLGNGSTNATNIPLAVSNLTGIIAAASRDQYTLYLLSDSTVWAVGYNGYGQFGNGTTTNSDIPVQIPNLSGVVKIAVGFYHSLFLKSDSTVWSCGRNFSGELGDGTQIQRDTLVQVSSLSGIIDIAAGDYHSMFLKSDSTVWSCGDNQNGCLGLGSGPLQIINPTQVTSISGVKLIAGGFRHSLFIKHDGSVYASGLNGQGQLGDSTNVDRIIPVQISSLSGIVSITAGQYHSIFLKDDGTVWASGANLFGQLGSGNNDNTNYPVQVSGLTDVVKISASGYYHSLYLKSDNTFWASGQNNDGRLGDGTFIDRNIPVLVLDGCLSTAIDEISNELEMMVYPNPSNGSFNMKILGILTSDYIIEIYNLTGKIVYSEKTNSSNTQIDLSNNSKGLYFYKIKSKDQVMASGKIVVN